MMLIKTKEVVTTGPRYFPAELCSEEDDDSENNDDNGEEDAGHTSCNSRCICTGKKCRGTNHSNTKTRGGRGGGQSITKFKRW